MEAHRNAQVLSVNGKDVRILLEFFLVHLLPAFLLIFLEFVVSKLQSAVDLSQLILLLL